MLGTPISTVDNELIRHNLAVFRHGENALQVSYSLHLNPETRGSRKHAPTLSSSMTPAALGAGSEDDEQHGVRGSVLGLTRDAGGADLPSAAQRGA